MRRLLVAFVSIFLSALSAFASDWKSEAHATDACFAAVDREPVFQALRLRLVSAEPSVAQLSNESLASIAEIDSIRSRSLRVRPCRDQMLAAVGGHHPALLHAHELRYFQTDLVYVKLIQRQITFGNANRLMNESYLEFWQRIVAYDRARSDAERRQQAEENRRLADQARRLGENFEQVRGVVL